MTKATATLSGLLAVLVALLLVACSETATPDIQATIDAAVNEALSDSQSTPSAGSTANQPTDADNLPTNADSSRNEVARSDPTSQPDDDPTLRDISQSQHEQLDQLLVELAENPEILATCAREAGDTVPAPGASGEAAWYAQAAVKYSACAASESTGIDFTGGN